MEIDSIITGAALPCRRGRRCPRGARSAGCRRPRGESPRVPQILLEARLQAVEVVNTSPELPLSASHSTDMVAATRRYRHAVPPVRGWLLVARLPPG
jgi:hypothetical protein